MGKKSKDNPSTEPSVIEATPENLRRVSLVPTGEEEVPDGGLKAYLVVLASFLANGLIFSAINSFSVIYSYLKKSLAAQNITGMDVQLSLLGVLPIALLFATSPVSGICSGLYGMRVVAVTGGFITASGCMLSAFVSPNVKILCFSYGVLYGLGCSLAYTPSIAVLGLYFKKRLGIVNGIVSIGSPIFTVLLPPVLEATINGFGLNYAFGLLAIAGVCIGLLGLTHKGRIGPKIRFNNTQTLLNAVICIEMWKIKRYTMWAIFLPISLFGYFITYVHIKQYMIDKNWTDFSTNIPLQCMSAASAVGRICFGLVSDRKSCNKIFLQQVSLIGMGVTTLFLPFSHTPKEVVIISVLLGIFEGGYITLIGPSAIQLAGRKYAAQGIGCMLGIASIPLSAGPVIGAAFYDHFGNYTVAFIFAGIAPICGGCLMFLIHCVGRQKKSPQEGPT